MGLISRVSSRTYRFAMQIFLKDEETHAVEVEPTTTLSEIVDGDEEVSLFYAGKMLDDLDMTIEVCGIEGEATIQLVFPVLGGGRKRKKKVYTTPKKIKLAALKFYKVTDTGKIERIGGRWIKPFQTTF